jgi:hypothetical protein
VNNQKAPNMLSDFKMKLSAPPVNGANKAAAFQVGIYKNNPRFIVRTNVEGDKNYGKIEAPMDVFTFFAAMNTITEVANSEGETHYSIENHDYIYPGGKRSDSPVLVSTTHIGKEQDGRVYIAVTANNRPKVKFYFESPMYHFIKGKDREAIPASKDSRAYALAWVDAMSRLVPLIMKDEFVPYVPKNQRQGGGSNWGGNNGGGNWGGSNGGNNGGGNWGGNNNGGGDGDDIPF